MSQALPITAYDRDTALIEVTRADGRARVAVRRVDEVAVVLGNGSRAEVELHLEAIQRDETRVLRRRGGGCAVVLDPGNLVITVALPLPGLGGIKRSFASISSWLIDALAELGITGVEQRGVSDLAIDDRKIAGSCIHRAKDLLTYSTTLLVDPDLDLVERYLPHPPREPDYRRGRCHRDFMASLAGLAEPGPAIGPASFHEHLAPLLQRSLHQLVAAAPA